MTHVVEAIHLDIAPAQPVDPALAAISAFHACRERFDALIEATERADGDLSALGLEPGSPAHDQARNSMGLPALDETERSLGCEHDATLATALATVPRSLAGLRALAELIQDQGRQGAPAALLDLGSQSLDAALAQMPAATAT